MATTFDATAKSAAATSLITVEEADDYHARRLHASDWTAAATATKQAALMWASGLLTYTVDWQGERTGDSQALAWPRSGIFDESGTEIDDDTVPARIKDATAEYARQLIFSDPTADLKQDAQGLASMTVGSLKFDFRASGGMRRPVPAAVVELIGDWGTPQRSYVIGSPMRRA